MPPKWTQTLLIFLICLCSCICKQYHNYTLFRSIPKNKAQMDFFEKIPLKYEIDFWMRPGTVLKPVDFVISPNNRSAFLKEAQEVGLALTIIIADVQSAFNLQQAKPYKRHTTDSFHWDTYYRLNAIYDWLQDLRIENPAEMELMKIGQTHKNRDILAVRIALNDSRHRSKVIIEGGIHAREWISPALVTCLIDKILHAGTSRNYYLKKMARTYDWYFVPVLNPDGYEYSHTDDRLWRKNRNVYGVDLNRNFGHKFGSVGISYNQFAEEYCGPNAFSEKETQAMANFVRSKSKDLEYYISFHSYGQFMLLPYLNTRKYLDNFQEVKKMSMTAARRIRRKYRTLYTVGTGFETLGYLASGSSSDWVKKEFGTPYVVMFELRDRGNHGFALPPDQIMPTCLETIDGLISLLEPRTIMFKDITEMQIPRNYQSVNVLDKVLFIFIVFY